MTNNFGTRKSIRIPNRFEKRSPDLLDFVLQMGQSAEKRIMENIGGRSGANANLLDVDPEFS